ncbi:hypothetical protein [Salicibibacter kimchii]|uniref:hypothetical protein n=1 Tax=Salicibibacter kimchii TaxID=2099786 RepID=UPI001359E9B8|nr:hypothetical protein [Salicibibacter kimchii]
MRSCIVKQHVNYLPGATSCADYKLLDGTTGEVLTNRSVIFRDLPQYIVKLRIFEEATELAREAGYDHIINEGA